VVRQLEQPAEALPLRAQRLTDAFAAWTTGGDEVQRVPNSINDGHVVAAMLAVAVAVPVRVHCPSLWASLSKR
jgi:hypothetical protein